MMFTFGRLCSRKDPEYTTMKGMIKQAEEFVIQLYSEQKIFVVQL